MKFIVLDISSKTGWAYFESTPQGLVLLERGQRPQVEMLKHFSYPLNYLNWAQNIWDDIYDSVLSRRQFDAIVIEETAKGSKDAHAQKLLEWVHKHAAEFVVKNDVPAYYLQTGEWRQIAGCQMTKEEKKRNQKVRKGRKALGRSSLIEIDGKKVGLVGKKHVTIRRVNELFGLNLRVKENDVADALALGYAAYIRFFGGTPNAKIQIKEANS